MQDLMPIFSLFVKCFSIPHCVSGLDFKVVEVVLPGIEGRIRVVIQVSPVACPMRVWIVPVVVVGNVVTAMRTAPK